MNRSDLAPGILRNNWLNIRTLLKGVKWDNQTGEDDGFAVFATPIDSLVAGWKILDTYWEDYGLKSIDTIIPRWAPPSENDTASYIAFICQQTGITAGSAMRYPLMYQELLVAMVRREVGIPRVPMKLIVYAGGISGVPISQRGA